MFDTKRFLAVLTLLSAAALVAHESRAAEVFPGRVRNPDGLQANAAIAYNSLQDYYLLGYAGGGIAFVGQLSTDGIFSGEQAISPQLTANSMALSYNPVRNEFLYVWRNSSPNTIRGRYLDGDGNPIGNEFAISSGKKPRMDFDPVNQRYLLTFGASGTNVRYRVIDGDSTNPNPILVSGTIASGNAIADRVKFGDVAGKFLVAYIRTESSDNIYGKFVTTNPGNVTITTEFPIDDSSGTEQSPTLGYSSKENRWVCSYQNWPGGGVLPNVRVAVIDPSMSVTRRFNVIATPAWEIPNGIVYNATTETLVFTWRHSQGAVEDSRAREWTVSDAGASAVGNLIILSTDNAAVTAGAARTDPVDPQVTILWRIGNGGDGVHAGILHVNPPPPDLTAPDPVDDLAGQTGGPDLMIADPLAFDVSNEQGAHPGEDSVDDDLASYWGTPGVSALQDEWIIWDLQAPKNLNSVVFWARSSGDFFPLNYDVDVSLNGVDFDTVDSIAGAVVAPGASTQHDFAPVSAQFVRLNVTLPRQTSGGNYKVQLAEATFFEAQNTPGMVTASWTATGDDGGVGAAKTYHLKWSEDPIDDGNFGSAMDVAGLPLPQLAGNPETVTIMGLPDETEVYLALKVEDDNMNVSDINTPAAAPVNTPGIPPAPVANLQVSYPGGDMADLTWQATGDDGLIGNLPDDPPGGTYDLRYATFPINDSNFNDASPISGGGPVPTPGNVGFVENYTATDLPAETTVYFGIKVLDELGNASPTDISPTEPMVTTADFSFPDAILDLREAVGGAAVEVGVNATDASAEVGSKPRGNATDDNPDSFWRTPAVAPREEFITIDTGNVHNISRVKLLSRAGNGSFFPEEVEIQVSNDPTTGFVTADTFSGLSDAGSTLHELELTTPVLGQYVKVLVTQGRTNSNGLLKVEIAEIDICESPVVLGAVNLLWTAPGDNGPVGQAFSYDLRWSEMPINAGNWDDPGVNPFALPTPLEGGMDEMATVTGLPDETMIYFAMTTDDEVMNTSLLSNVATAFTPGIAPEPIDDFEVTGFTGVTADLQWTARADTGPLGRASSYDLRYSASGPITSANFHMATAVSPAPPIPANAGVQQNHLVTGLPDSTSIWFAIKAVDAAMNESSIHTNGDVMIVTPDETSPAQVTDLMATSSVPTLSIVPATAIDASGEASDDKSKEKATDQVESTYFGTPGRPPQLEYITVDTEAVRVLAQVRLRSPDQTKMFPEDVEIQVSNSPMSGFVTVGTFTGLPDTKSMWHTLDFTDSPGRYLRVLVTKARTTNSGAIRVEISEIEVWDTSPAGTLTLSFASPGDDPGLGTPSFYDLRFSTSAILDDDDFNNATEVTGEPTVNLASFGQQESFEIQAPQEGVTLHFAIKAGDEASPPNLSPLSNNETFVTPIVEPSAISDLTVTRVTSLSAELTFTATGDDGLVGNASSYTVKRSTSDITDDVTFNNATTVTTGVPTPEAPGTMQTIYVTGLNPSTTYYFAMKVNDEITSSQLSNVPMAATDVPDTIPPVAVADLRGGPPVTIDLVPTPPFAAFAASSESRPKENATDGDLSTDWRAVNQDVDGGQWITVDTGASRLISRVRLRSPSGTTSFPEDVDIEVSDNAVDFNKVAEATGLPTTKGMWHTIDFTPAMGQYVRINITKMRFTTNFRAHIAEIEVYEATFTPGDITLAWTAPGDDGDVGQATEYDLRWSNVAGALEANFLGQPSLATDPPQASGAVEMTDPIAGLPPGTLYFAIKTRDEVTNQFSEISNVLVINNP